MLGGMVTTTNYWTKFAKVVNLSKTRGEAARKLKVTPFYVSWNASRLRRKGVDIKTFPTGRPQKGAKA